VNQKLLTKTLPATQVRQKFGECLKEVYRRQVRIIVEKDGIPVAALVSLADLERWNQAETAPTDKEVTAVRRELLTVSPPTPEELARRQAVAAKILTLREQCDISPLTTTDLIHQVRQEREKAYARWTK